MTQTKAMARKLATKAEWVLLERSFPPLLKEITVGRLKQKVTLARKLQDKYRDLARQQRGEARGKRRAKGARPAAGNANTMVKHEIFAEALSRFETQLAKLEAKAAKESARQQRAAERLATRRARTAGTPAKVTKARKVTKAGKAAKVTKSPKGRAPRRRS
jgi:hypothetical protein